MDTTVKYSDEMFKASRSGDVTALEGLAKKGAPINGHYSWGYPITIASISGKLDAIRKLADLGADLDIIGDEENKPTLNCIASERLHLSDDENLIVLALLLELGANPDVQDSLHCRTPLLVALYHSKFDRAKLLLEAGANPEIGDRFAADAYDYAIYFEAAEIIEMLRQLGGYEAVEKIQVARLADQLIRAAENEDMDSVAALLTESANVNKVDLYGQDALFQAADKGNLELIELLLEHGADPNNLKNTKTALMTSAYRGHRKAFDLLLDAGADIFASFEVAPDVYDDALHFAEEGRHKELAAHIKAEMKRRSKK